MISTFKLLLQFIHFQIEKEVCRLLFLFVLIDRLTENVCRKELIRLIKVNKRHFPVRINLKSMSRSMLAMLRSQVLEGNAAVSNFEQRILISKFF